MKHPFTSPGPMLKAQPAPSGSHGASGLSKEPEMNTIQLEVGTRIYNHGDMANFPHFGTITKIIKSNRFSDQYEITPDAESDREGSYTVCCSAISPEFKGHSGTRIVTEKAYREYRKAQLKGCDSIKEKAYA